MENLKSLGLSKFLEDYVVTNNVDLKTIARVAEEHKERYVINTGSEELNAEVTGNMRFSADSRLDFPAVGDWVVYQKFDDDFAIINQLLPRYSSISRKSVNKDGEIQLIAANIDFAFLVQAVDQDFNINRLERYLTIVKSGKVKPIVLLSKIDLIDKEILDGYIKSIKEREEDIEVFPFSNESGEGLDPLEKSLIAEKSYCLLGSSGVGKSTLINRLLNTDRMDTRTISDSTGKGKHTTTHREMILLENNSILIDTPGMREIGVTDNKEGLEETFEDIEQYMTECKFTDCTHSNEPGCAVLEALETGNISKQKFENYLKLKKESDHFARTSLEKKKRDKDFGKMVKSIMKDVKKRKK